MQTGEWYVRSAEGLVYGPADMDTLAAWAAEGRIEPTGYVSRDRRDWIPAQLVPQLGMRWVVEAEPGRFYGPFNRALVVRLAAEGSIPSGANIYRKHDLPPDKDPEPQIVEKIVEKVVEKEVPVEVEKIVEKVVVKEVPVEVEKIVEKVVVKEVPVEVEKIVVKEVPVEVEKIVVKEVPVEVEKIVERVVEVEPPPRRAISGGSGDRPATGRPPAPAGGGMFGDGSASRLAALEEAARRELAAWNRMMGK